VTTRGARVALAGVRCASLEEARLDRALGDVYQLVRERLEVGRGLARRATQMDDAVPSRGRDVRPAEGSAGGGTDAH
jgi:hypothetical protein